LSPENLLNHVITNPNEPISNVFHLAEKNIEIPGKGPGYRAERDAVEKSLFPEIAGHEVRPDERPVYGALNIGQDAIGGATLAYGDASIVLKPEVAKRSTYIADDTFYSPRVEVNDKRLEMFYLAVDNSSQISQELRTALLTENSQERKDFKHWIKTIGARPDCRISNFKNVPSSIAKYFKSPEDEGFFKGIFTEYFVNKEATRKIVSSYDNLESLIVNLDDIDGNALARASQAKKMAAILVSL
ncbi:MAG: DUF3626 domain-containing protein, partial [Desulfovibrionaceae bacterium]|nr:DUF3626 domain-containing protein [Desulfovibrionaceae bacterium]